MAQCPNKTLKRGIVLFFCCHNARSSQLSHHKLRKLVDLFSRIWSRESIFCCGCISQGRSRSMHKLCAFPVASSSSSSSSSFCCGVSGVLCSNDKARDNNSWKLGLGLGLGCGGGCCCCCFRSVPVGSSWNSKSGSSCSSNSITTRRRCVITNLSQRKRWKSEPLVKGKVTRRALHIIKEIRGLEYQTDDVLERVLRKWVRTMTPGRRELLDMLKEFDNADDRELYYKISEWSFKESWFEVCVRDYTKLIDSYGRNSHIEQAEATMRCMEEQGIMPDLAAYTVLIAAYGRAQQLDRARGVLEEIRLAGIQPDATMYKSLMIAYGNVGLPQQSEALLTDMEIAGVEGNADTYLALMTAYGRLGQAKEAQRIFDLMHWKGFRGSLKAFTALMDAYSRAGDVDSVQAVFDSLRFAKLQPDDWALAILVGAYRKANMLGTAMQVLADLESVRIKPGPLTLRSLAGEFGKI